MWDYCEKGIKFNDEIFTFKHIYKSTEIWTIFY